jgi:putative membrane protein
MLSAIVSALHLLALAIGLPAIYLRGRALKGRLDAEGFRHLFAADSVWGIAAFLWLATGLLRAFAGIEKGTAFYLASRLFWTKMALFVLIIVLELPPMLALLRWRAQIRRGQAPDTSRARVFYVISHVEMTLVVLIVFVAAFMARGFGMR